MNRSGDTHRHAQVADGLTISEPIDDDVALVRARNRYSLWKMAKARLLEDVWPASAPSFRLNPGAKIFTIGSCFARNIEEHLQILGFRIPMLDFRAPREEYHGERPTSLLDKYTPPTIFQTIEWARNIFLKEGKITEADSTVFLYDCDEGSCIDTGLDRARPVRRERFFERRSQIYNVLKEVFSADCVVITLGLIEAWFDHEKGVYIEQAPIGKYFAQNRARFGFKRLSYDESRRFVQGSIDAIRDINKDAKFLITTSPVPLARTFTDDDVIVANTYSKSVLRAVAGDIAASNKKVDYFPSYESVMLTKSWNVWKEDLRHVSDMFVGKVVGRLIDTYCSGLEEGLKLFQESNIELSAGAPERALELARQAVERSPEVGDLRGHLGKLLTQRGDLIEAEAQFAKGICLNPGDPALYRQLSEVLARQKRFEEAVQAARRSTELAPDNAECHRHFAHLWVRQRKLLRAAIHFGLAAGHRRMQRTKRHRLKHFLRLSLPLLQRMTCLYASHT